MSNLYVSRSNTSYRQSFRLYRHLPLLEESFMKYKL